MLDWKFFVGLDFLDQPTSLHNRQDFTLDFYFRQSWKDDRLAFIARPGLDSLTVGAEVADLIWVPDTFFANEKTAYFHQATTPNTFLRINSEGEVFRSMR
ncbi:Gamma-aminobutyric acid receptor subunit beta [Araneus ventricosus]|uniref:Gamma-aminobutyric acid receptor subunit beta n=1 Tax=Araneus ventricosus TaxID=182803 RepID=A0A4Y2HW79_ARAVE|nr:Gamma-aminobutyric acid receptor subunit beta [Araneus ventricosus]